MDIEVEIDATSGDVAAQQTRLVGLAQGALKAGDRLVKLAPDVVVAHGSANAVTRDGHALDQLMRVVAQDVTVLAGARLALVRIADQVLLARVLAGHKAPLEARREAGPAPPTQIGKLQLIDDVVGIRPLPQDFLPLAIAADAAIGRQGPRLIQMQGAEADRILTLVH